MSLECFPDAESHPDGLPAARLASSGPPIARLAIQPPGWAGADVFRILFLT
ncbi:hypothetical protein Tco_0620473, partial [Tanacetum coccineum]